MANRNWGFLGKAGFEAAQAAIETEKNLPHNCFTLGRFGSPKEGIVLSLERGPDQLRPWEPHVLLGGYRIHRDRAGGCVYQKNADGTSGLTRRAVAKRVDLDSGKGFFTLVRPETDKVFTSLVLVNFGLPFAKGGVVVNDHELRLFAGVEGGTLVGRDGLHALVELAEGELCTVFYEDGAVRTFRRQGVALIEEYLDNEEMLHVRIAHAERELDRAETIEYEDRRKRTLHAILGGMADLIHLTTRFDRRGLGQEMRRTLLRDFFLKLAPSHLERVHPKVVAILHQVDPALLAMLRRGSSVMDELPEGVSDIAVARDRARREADRHARQLERVARQPKKGPSGSKQKVTTNPKKAAKQKRNS